MININYIIVPLHRANLYSSCGLSQDLRRYDGDHGETKLFSSWARSFQPQFTNITMCVCVFEGVRAPPDLPASVASKKRSSPRWGRTPWHGKRSKDTRVQHAGFTRLSRPFPAVRVQKALELDLALFRVRKKRKTERTGFLPQWFFLGYLTSK